jgi:hypothetical protein
MWSAMTWKKGFVKVSAEKPIVFLLLAAALSPQPVHARTKANARTEKRGTMVFSGKVSAASRSSGEIEGHSKTNLGPRQEKTKRDQHYIDDSDGDGRTASREGDEWQGPTVAIRSPR